MYTKNKLSKYIIAYSIAVLLLLVYGCKKLIEVQTPIDQVISREVYNNSSTATGVLTGIYFNMSEGSFAAGGGGISAFSGFSSDELTINNINNNDFQERVFKNNLSATILTPGLWGQLYLYIFRVNAALEGLSTSSKLPSKVKKQLIGEAKFLRAFYFFNLINLYGDAPLVLTTDYKLTSIAARTPMSEVYSQIEKDLLEAKETLSQNFVGADAVSLTQERIRPTKAAATALLARVYLYESEWQKAEIEATEIITNPNFELLPDLKQIFLKNSREAIWQLQPVHIGLGTPDGMFFSPIGGTDIRNILSLSKFVNNTFEIGDLRKLNWVDSILVGGNYYPYPAKYKVQIQQDLTEYQMVLRIGEQYLIRAEARAHLNRLSGVNSALEDLNAIRTRANLTQITTGSMDDILSLIYKERRYELFTEGHRWFDLKRTGTINEVMPIVATSKGGSWNANKQLYPIPQDDINKNPNLRGHQNPGY
nr:RagB/SusD family nutrient uptake outer membrane protein [uncultured Pedobacter sp.]